MSDFDGSNRESGATPGFFARARETIGANIAAIVNSLREGGEKKREAALVAAIAAQKQATRLVEHLQAETQKWHRRAELAVAAGDDELAAAAWVRKREIGLDLERIERERMEAQKLAERIRSEMARVDTLLERVDNREPKPPVEATSAPTEATPADSLRSNYRSFSDDVPVSPAPPRLRVR